MQKGRNVKAQTSVKIVSGWTSLLSFVMNGWFNSNKAATRSRPRQSTEQEQQDNPCPRPPTRRGCLHLILALRILLNAWSAGIPMVNGFVRFSRNLLLSTGTKKWRRINCASYFFHGGHAVKDCKMNECGIDGCKRRHNRLLHRPEDNKIPDTASTETVETHASVSLNTFGNFHVYVVEFSEKGKRLKVLALVDSGSSLPWIDK